MLLSKKLKTLHVLEIQEIRETQILSLGYIIAYILELIYNLQFLAPLDHHPIFYSMNTLHILHSIISNYKRIQKRNLRPKWPLKINYNPQ